MIVVSDTSPLNYLILVGHIDILSTLFGEVTLPSAVLAELQHPGTPLDVRQWIDRKPDWILIESPMQIDPTIQLGSGESAAISLAVELQASLLLIDDRMGRRAAKARGLTVAGTLNVLEAAAERELIDLPTAIRALRATNFHVSERLLTKSLQRDEKRRGGN